jgi:superfamily II DNA or RNA helicase
LAEHGGQAKWIASPKLHEEDWQAIKRGEKAKRNDVIRKALEETVQNLETAIEEDIRSAISWMVYDGLLDIKLAVPTNELTGDFHDKFGIFIDVEGNRVAFHGSKNDSQHALENYESYSVFCDWWSADDAERVNGHERRFDDLWVNDFPHVATYTIPESVINDIVSPSPDSDRPYPTPDSKEDDTEIVLRDYQQSAIDAWFENGHEGMFKMATGTGKTYTAIGGLRQLFDMIDVSLGVIIAVPVTHLAEQWRESLSEWGFNGIQFVYGTANTDWKTTLKNTISDLEIGVRDQAFLITTHTTLSNEYFRNAVEEASCDLMVIADEVHGLGSEHQRKGLSEAYTYRLGLSATPTRYYDEAGTDVLDRYFGGIVFEFDLADAIPDYLTVYEYYPQIVEMTPEEIDEYRQFSTKLATEASKEDPDRGKLEQLSIKRARILKAAENNYAKLSELLSSEFENPDHLLVYTNSEQIEKAQEILNEHGIVQHKFTYREDDNEREQLLTAFSTGEYDALVAIRCLDEGVDVPSTKQAILMSNSNNPKQFIQRRGRVLRKAEGKKKAKIYDMIVVPSLNPSRDIINSESKILRKELSRFEEFAKTATNETDARLTIQRLKTAYELRDSEDGD